MIVIKSDADLDRMRESGRMAATVRERLAAAVAPGMLTEELGALAADWIQGMGGESAFLGYHGFPGVICVSVNEEVVHGIPGKRRIGVGDVISIDVGVRYRGFIGDTATTVMVGVTDPEVIRLVNATREALEAGIQQATVGNRLSDISHAIEKRSTQDGFSVVREFVGHGIGKTMHEEPQIPNYGAPGRGPLLKAGMTLALEPMVNQGKAKVRVLEDGWTVVTADGKASCHFEHTVAIVDGKAEILSCPEEVPAKS